MYFLGSWFYGDWELIRCVYVLYIYCERMCVMHSRNKSCDLRLNCYYLVKMWNFLVDDSTGF